MYTCPDGLSHGKIVLLVPGTGNTAPESWDAGYRKLIPPLGYDVCYISPPPFLLGDAQDNAEYVVQAIRRAYATYNKQVTVMAWSQGNLDIQWAVTFFPQTRALVSNFISLAGDFGGTVDATVLCQVAGQVYACTPSVWQQQSTSNFVAALQKRDLSKAVVPTTSIYSLTDEVVQLEFGPAPSSQLQGAANFPYQQYCGAKLLEHGQELYDGGVYAIVKDALTRGAPAQASAINFSSACQMASAPGLTPADVATLIGALGIAGANVAAYPDKVTSEPPLRAYAS